jgi:hypothetical protein
MNDALRALHALQARAVEERIQSLTERSPRAVLRTITGWIVRGVTYAFCFELWPWE